MRANSTRGRWTLVIVFVVLSLSEMITQRTESAVQSGEFIAPDMVRIPGGTFMMGSDRGYPDEKPVHQVQVPPSRWHGTN